MLCCNYRHYVVGRRFLSLDETASKHLSAGSKLGLVDHDMISAMCFLRLRRGMSVVEEAVRCAAPQIEEQSR